MTNFEIIEKAGEFVASIRGQFILAKALHYAIGELEKVEGAFREVSDIADMKYLQETLYRFPIELLDERIGIN